MTFSNLERRDGSDLTFPAVWNERQDRIKLWRGRVPIFSHGRRTLVVRGDIYGISVCLSNAGVESKRTDMSIFLTVW